MAARGAVTAAEVKQALRGRYPALHPVAGPHAWTCLEEWSNIDLLAVCAWSSWKGAPPYARIGHEVKVSRADYKRELTNPGKRRRAVEFCHEFYFVVPHGLLKREEIAWIPPLGFGEEHDPFQPERCPGAFGAYCLNGEVRFGRGHIKSRWDYAGRLGYYGTCPTCRGRGWVLESPVVRAQAPKLWVPADVGLIVVTEEGRCITSKKAPRRNPEKPLSDGSLADLVRWTSVRPDPRHRELHR